MPTKFAERSMEAEIKAAQREVVQGDPRLEAALARHYGRGGWSSVMVTGPPASCVAGVRDAVQAGAELILLNPLVDDVEQMERLAGEVMPAV